MVVARPEICRDGRNENSSLLYSTYFPLSFPALFHSPPFSLFSSPLSREHREAPHRGDADPFPVHLRLFSRPLLQLWLGSERRRPEASLLNQVVQGQGRVLQASVVHYSPHPRETHLFVSLSTALQNHRNHVLSVPDMFPVRTRG